MGERTIYIMNPSPRKRKKVKNPCLPCNPSPRKRNPRTGRDIAAKFNFIKEIFSNRTDLIKELNENPQFRERVYKQLQLLEDIIVDVSIKLSQNLDRDYEFEHQRTSRKKLPDLFSTR